MPLSFIGSIAEHRWVREAAGIFDISHMGRLSGRGKDFAPWIERWTTIDAENLAAGSCRYGFVVGSNGGIIDDAYLFRIEDDEWMFVVNAANRRRVLETCTPLGNMELADRTESTGMIALQGPQSDAVWTSLGFSSSPAARNLVWKEGKLVVSRTGYTGEYGLEIVGSAEEIRELWRRLAASSLVRPVGLAARDSLRFEAGYFLYGHELNDTMIPAETGLRWAIRKDRLDRLAASVELSKRKPLQAVYWLQMEDRSVPRPGYRVLDGKMRQIGTVASGMYSPSMDGFYASALGTLESKPLPGEDIYVEIRGTPKAAGLIRPPILGSKS